MWEETPVQGRRQLDMSFEGEPWKFLEKKHKTKKKTMVTQNQVMITNIHMKMRESCENILEIQMNNKKTKNDIHERGNNNRFT